MSGVFFAWRFWRASWREGSWLASALRTRPEPMAVFEPEEASMLSEPPRPLLFLLLGTFFLHFPTAVVGPGSVDGGQGTGTERSYGGHAPLSRRRITALRFQESHRHEGEGGRLAGGRTLGTSLASCCRPLLKSHCLKPGPPDQQMIQSRQIVPRACPSAWGCCLSLRKDRLSLGSRGPVYSQGGDGGYQNMCNNCSISRGKIARRSSRPLCLGALPGTEQKIGRQKGRLGAN